VLVQDRGWLTQCAGAIEGLHRLSGFRRQRFISSVTISQMTRLVVGLAALTILLVQVDSRLAFTMRLVST
jgi:hypothetical protein